ncbi:DUF6493 family protein, partial [Streptomyces sp. TRM 70361]
MTEHLSAADRQVLDAAARELDPDAYAVLLAVADRASHRLPALIAALSDRQRRSCVPHLEALRARWDEAWQDELRPYARTLVVAGAGCHTGASAAARWLRHPHLDLIEADDATALLTILAARPAEWLGDVAHRIVGPRLEYSWGKHYPLVKRLVLLSGCPVPTTEVFVQGWVRDLPWPQATDWPVVVDGALAPAPAPHYGGAERLCADPFLDTLLPRLFEVNGVGSPLIAWFGGSNSMSASLAELAAEGRLDRAALIDDCLSRLLRSGRREEMSGFHLLLIHLDPTEEEYAGRVTVLLRMLSDAPTDIAVHAQETLVALDTAGRLDAGQLAEASRAALFRREKKLVRAQLKWLDTAARRDRERAGAVVLAAADALGHQDTAIQELALDLIARHLPHAGDAVSGELAAAAEAVSPVLRPRAAELLGLETTAAGSTGTADVLPPAPVPQPMAPPLATPAEVAEEVNAVLTAARRAARPGTAAATVESAVEAAAFERALDGLVRHGYQEREKLLRALEPVVRAHPWQGRAVPRDDLGPLELRLVVAVLCGEEPFGGPRPVDPRAGAHPHTRLSLFEEALAARV